jgi:predicted MPP superfamily phosphohydrolase
MIVLSHDPDVFPKIPARAALTLAGHTHGGQINVPIIRRKIIPSRYIAGTIDENGKRMFITRGIGETTAPLRLAAPPEVAILRLKSSPNS